MAERHAESTLQIATALNPHIGYDRAAEIVKEAVRAAAQLREVASEKGVDEATLDEALDHQARWRARTNRPTSSTRARRNAAGPPADQSAGGNDRHKSRLEGAL